MLTKFKTLNLFDNKIKRSYLIGGYLLFKFLPFTKNILKTFDKQGLDKYNKTVKP